MNTSELFNETDINIEGLDIKIPRVRLSNHEKHFIEKIACVSGYDFEIVKKIFLTIAICTTMDLYSSDKEIQIPYLFRIKLNKLKDINEFLDKDIKIEINNTFKQVIDKINNKQETWVEEYILLKILSQLNETLNLES